MKNENTVFIVGSGSSGIKRQIIEAALNSQPVPIILKNIDGQTIPLLENDIKPTDYSFSLNFKPNLIKKTLSKKKNDLNFLKCKYKKNKNSYRNI